MPAVAKSILNNILSSPGGPFWFDNEVFAKLQMWTLAALTTYKCGLSHYFPVCPPVFRAACLLSAPQRGFEQSEKDLCSPQRVMLYQ